MPRGTLFVDLEDGTNHVLSIEERTACGIEVPHGRKWTTERPRKLCAECAKKVRSGEA